MVYICVRLESRVRIKEEKIKVGIHAWVEAIDGETGSINEAMVEVEAGGGRR
jgi:hypothetical protein